MPINQSQKIITELNCTNFPNLKRNRSHNGPKYLIYIGMHSCTLYKIIAISIAVGSINLKGYKVDANVFYDVAFCLFCTCLKWFAINMIVGRMQKIKILNSYLLVSPAGMYVGTSYFYVNFIYKKRKKHNGFGQSHCLKVCKKSA